MPFPNCQECKKCKIHSLQPFFIERRNDRPALPIYQEAGEGKKVITLFHHCQHRRSLGIAGLAAIVVGFVTHGKAFVVDKSATSEGLIDQVFLFLVWIYPESYTFLHHPCLYTIYFLSIQVFGLFSITCVNSMYMSYIPIAEARGFTTHLIKSPSFMIHLPLRLFTYFYFECR